MIILNKKRLGVICGILLISLFAFTFQTANLNNTVQTVSLPVSNKVIVLDARTPENQTRELKALMVQQKRKLI